MVADPSLVETRPAARRTILALTWADDGPHLRVRDVGAGASRLVPVAGFDLNYRADPSNDPRACLGHVPFRSDRGGYSDCAAPPVAGARRCDRCTMLEATFASNLHHAHTRGRSELDPAVVAHLAQPNHLYLAAFRDGSMKVGTSTAARLDRRLAEQGAWAARIVARSDDGYAVREIEDRVTAALDLPQSVSAARKLTGLVSPRADAEIEARLADLVEPVHALVVSFADSRLTPQHDSWHNPATGSAELDRLHRYPLKLTSGQHDLRLVTAIGSLVIATRSEGDDRFAINLKGIFGVEVETGDFASDEIAIQDSLF